MSIFHRSIAILQHQYMIHEVDGYTYDLEVADFLDRFHVDESPNSRAIAKAVLHSMKLAYNESEIDFLQSLIITLHVHMLERGLPNAVIVPLDRSAYSSNARLGKLHYSYRSVKKIVKALQDSSYITVFKGFHTKNIGRSTRIVPRDTLLKAIQGEYTMKKQDYRLNYPDDLILLRNENGNMNYEDNAYTKKARKFLMSYNAFLAGSNIDVGYCVYPFLYRVFTKRPRFLRFTSGGRFYCLNTNQIGYQALPKKSREKITINGQNVCELDFSGLHMNLAYLQTNAQLSVDPYAFSKVATREQTKKMSLIAMNARNITTARRAFVQEYGTTLGVRQSFKLSKTLLEEFAVAHKPIQHLLCADRGIHFQFHDSEIMASILEACITKNIPALPMHDSVIVADSDKRVVKQIMQESFAGYCAQTFKLDFTPEITIH